MHALDLVLGRGHWVKTTYVWVLVRILGVLLAALGVDLIITGLEQLHVLAPVADG